jgi:hypothetical protein
MVEALELVDTVQGVYWSTDGKGQPQTAVYRIAAAPFCKVVHLGLAQDSRLKLNVWSRAIAGWEELRISVYPSKSSVDDIIHGGEFFSTTWSTAKGDNKVSSDPNAGGCVVVRSSWTQSM